MAEKKEFIPLWRETPPVEGTYRSIFKWGHPLAFKHPNNKLYRELKTVFGLGDEEFQKPRHEGDEPVLLKKPPRIKRADIAALEKIAGEENVSVKAYDRVKFSRGKTIEEAMKLRAGDNGDTADLVVHPRDKEDVRKIVAYCSGKGIPLYVYGGGSSVTFGLNPARGGVTLVLSTHMNRLVEFNELNQTATVQAGMLGPAYEDLLNSAPEKLGARRRYTCGHYPQSFEYSSVGGWVVTLGSGQASSYYGDAGDLVVSQEYVTPAGTFKTLDYPATATGPRVNDIMKGSEGSFGVLVEVTMKVYRYMPKNRQRFGFIFPTWDDAVNASREISQGEFGMPAVFRISDPEETHIGLKLYGIDGTPIDRLMSLRGYRPMERCLFLGSAEGEKQFARNVKKQVKKICRAHGGMYLTGFATKQWEPGRYRDPYLREDLHDYGILIDTLETGVTWSNIHRVHREVRAFIKSRPRTVCMTHASHFYPQGTNLYFIFIARIDDVKEYKKLQDGIIDAIYRSGGSLSHHHGVGKMISPWMERHLGSEQMDVLRALKKHFDPKNVMNPGGQLGLDIKGKKR
ncbi:MAG TPA: FAD-binding oxidoreductase [Spirochaetota bacterium]|nr:FAD-binding oxidoreductase [Spirochaetota bacterium]HPI91176.1 FAD-binding oxidoreductase [Spirochaetota bacterium]HPR47188.1 FAD-binding oxidoreductase [Spirochaetota bacterium]